MSIHSKKREFLESIGFDINAEPWSIHIQWSTVNPKNWVLMRNSLLSSDLLLTLSINDRYWNVSLQRKDEVFYVQWRESGLSVDSQQLKFKKIVKWPEITCPSEVIKAIGEIEKVLNVSFYQYVNIQGTLIESVRNQKLFTDWLGSTANGYGCFE